MRGLEALYRRYESYTPGLLGLRRNYAVLCPFVERNGEPHVLLEVRAKELRQGGEVCFPGGAMEAGETAAECALRETEEELGIPHERILGVHQPFMERRITAAMGVYWPELDFSVTSPQVSIESYLADAKRQGVTEEASISVIVGDFQRMDLYAKKGYQLPQYIPQEAWEAFRELVAMGYDKQLAK